MDLSPDAVGRAVAEVLGGEMDGVVADGAVVARVERLDRGFSWVTLMVAFESADDDGTTEVIVRVAPRGGPLDPYDPTVEAANLRRVDGVVPAPRVLAVQPESANPIGRPFGVHTRVPGRVLRLDEVAEQPAQDAEGPDEEGNPAPKEGIATGTRPRYVAAAARALGRLHELTAPVTVAEAYDAELDRTEAAYRRAAPDRHREFEAALSWLRAHRPTSRNRRCGATVTSGSPI